MNPKTRKDNVRRYSMGGPLMQMQSGGGEGPEFHLASVHITAGPKATDMTMSVAAT